ncbi:MAC/perforin domain-containing protein [Prevotella communis]|uniref:MAC/perforin domain-containing protein n=1 Tax=Prevotella communis TaxID=2913614 RepID=UPI001EDA3917|nr:MAC/perforin domain-containing protein [Prevotella communis]UKK55476.1 MAC/perforin domain-containing protein [Prevotella communis]
MKATKYFFKSLTAVAGLVIMASLCFSCSDDDHDVPPVEVTPLELSEQQVEIGSDGRYYSVTMQVNGSDLSLQDVHATTDADWIRLEADTISRDGRLTFYVKPNTGGRSRDGIINLTLKSQFSILNSQFSVHQRCEAEDDANALNGDSITRKARVGWGYNMLIDYMNPECVTEPILDYEKLVQAEQTWGTIIAEEGRAHQSLSYHSSYSVEEMSSWMSQQTTTEVDFLFVNKSVKKYQQTSEYDLSQQTFGYSSLRKVVATRYVDEGKVQSIIRQGDDIFTREFRDIYNQVNSSPTNENVRQMIQKFGTHLVTYADLGGRLDYSVNFRSEETSRETVEKYLKYKNGMKKEDKDTQTASHAIISNGGLHFDIYGGTEAVIAALENHASTKDRYGQVDPGVLGEWLNSIKTSDPQSVSLVCTTLQPIWQLFTNQEARAKIISHILALAYSEAGEVGARLQDLGLDNYYRFDVTNEMQQFGSDAGSTLAKIIYFQGLPKVEVCNEYVPELRADRRVTIFYPIYKGKTNIRRGFFLGDGENTPAEVTFDQEGGCYVRQLEKYNPDDRITTLYYIDGGFYPTSMGIEIPNYQMTVKDEFLKIQQHPDYAIVKIGPGFWTRTNVEKRLYFGKRLSTTSWHYYEQEYQGVLYADVFYPRNPLMLQCDALGTADSHTGDIPEGYWYLPSTQELNALQQYIGRNPKTLFHRQQTGFEATFDGCMMYHDFLKNEELDNRTLRYQGEKCFIAFKNTRSDRATGGTALMLSSDYSLRECPIEDVYDNWYPVRLYRDSKYRHLDL